MKNNPGIDRLGALLIFLLLVIISPVRSMGANEKDVCILSLECQHFIKKIEYILAVKEGKKFSDKEKEAAFKYIETSFESMAILLDNHSIDEMLFPNVKSVRLRIDTRMNMLGRLNTTRIFDFPHFSRDDDDDDAKFIEQLNVVKATVIRVSKFIPKETPDHPDHPAESSEETEQKPGGKAE